MMYAAMTNLMVRALGAPKAPALETKTSFLDALQRQLRNNVR